MTQYAQQSSDDRELATLNADVDGLKFVPGWNRPGNPPLWNSPRTTFQPAVWNYRAAKQALERAGEVVAMEFAERRNLIMANPVAGNRYPTVRTQVAAYQMLLPGERARTHRHSPHAGRLVIDADEGAYTVVEGVRLPMYPGDVLLTPGWHWHGHGHDGTKAACWLDFLDVPLVQYLDPMFFEPYPGGWQEPTTQTRESPLLFSWETSCRRLDVAQPHSSGYYGQRIELGAAALPTIGLFMHRLVPGTATKELRTTANYQFCVVEGEGRSVIDGKEISWSRGDVFLAPCWSSQEHYSDTGATLFEMNDEPLQRYCGYLRTSVDIVRGDGRHVPLEGGSHAD